MKILFEKNRCYFGDFNKDNEIKIEKNKTGVRFYNIRFTFFNLIPKLLANLGIIQKLSYGDNNEKICYVSKKDLKNWIYLHVQKENMQQNELQPLIQKGKFEEAIDCICDNYKRYIASLVPSKSETQKTAFSTPIEKTNRISSGETIKEITREFKPELDENRSQTSQTKKDNETKIQDKQKFEEVEAQKANKAKQLELKRNQDITKTEDLSSELNIAKTIAARAIQKHENAKAELVRARSRKLLTRQQDISIVGAQIAQAERELYIAEAELNRAKTKLNEARAKAAQPKKEGKKIEPNEKEETKAK